MKKIYSRAILLLLLLFCGAMGSTVWGQAISVDYVVIALDGSRALTITGQTARVGETIELPAKYQSPMLTSSDFSYYTAYNTTTKECSGPITTYAVEHANQTIYVKYHFEQEYTQRIGMINGGTYNVRRVGTNSGNGNGY